MLLVTNSTSDEVILYFVENSSGCSFNYLNEIHLSDKRFQTNHFYILIYLKRKIVFVVIRLSITSWNSFSTEIYRLREPKWSRTLLELKRPQMISYDQSSFRFKNEASGPSASEVRKSKTESRNGKKNERNGFTCVFYKEPRSNFRHFDPMASFTLNWPYLTPNDPVRP